MKQILITGGAGFIGSHLVEELIKNKNYNITVIDDMSSGCWDNICGFINKKQIIEEKLQNININKRFDIIYHLAAKINARDKCLTILEDNVMATETVVKLLKPNGHICFSSSCAVYGNQKEVTETSPFKPINPYGYSKIINEMTIKRCCKNHTIFRFSNVFGKRQDGSNENGLIGIIDYHLKNNKTMSVFNQGKNYRDYIYVKDVVNALTTINKQGIFQIGSNKTYNTLDLVKLSKVKWIYGETYDEVDNIKLNNKKLKKEGWKPTLEVTDYIKKN